MTEEELHYLIRNMSIEEVKELINKFKEDYIRKVKSEERERKDNE